jgi:hypothetical protein
MHALQAGGPHQPVGALVRAHDAGAGQPIADPTHTEASTMSGMDRLDPLGEGGPIQGPW